MTSQNQREALTCALCLDVFREPKLLPCSHTFCLKCLKDLVDQEDDSATSGTFPCPSCRNEIQVPKGGAAAFRVNLDIDPAELESLRDDTHCSVHQGKNLGILCVDCELLICIKCKQKTHFHHRSQALKDAVDTAKTQLSEQKPRLQSLLVDLERNLKKRERSQKDFQAKKAVVEREIRQRYSRLLVEIEKYRDDALAALQSSSIDVESTSNKELDDVRRNLHEARYLCQRIEQAEVKGEGCKLVTVAREMTSGSGSEAAVEKLEEVGHMTEVRQPVHRSVLPVDEAVFKTLKDFVGTFELVAIKCDAEDEEKDELETKEQFRCGDHDDVTVYCVKACQYGSTIVSFDPFYQEKTPKAKENYDNGRCKVLHSRDSEEQCGRRSFSERNKQFLIHYTQDTGKFYAKQMFTESSICLLRKSGIKCFIDIEELVSSDPVKVTTKELFSIEKQSYRALDMDSSQQNFVVVLDADHFGTQRSVRLYKRPPNPRFVHSCSSQLYVSPITPFQPSDVCFYKLQDHEVLLIADEANDAIHVVEVKDDKMTFTRFLCPGCPLLLQPTALNTDHKGRLWVGCRGGRLVTFQPASAPAAAPATAIVLAADDDEDD